MTKEEIDQFISQRIRNSQSQTLEAIYKHFVDGYTVADAANFAGIARGTASDMLYKIGLKVQAAGYEKSSVTRIKYQKPAKKKS